MSGTLIKPKGSLAIAILGLSLLASFVFAEPVHAISDTELNSIPQALAADGREKTSTNNTYIHLSNIPNGPTGIGANVWHTTVKMYTRNNGIDTANDSDTTIKLDLVQLSAPCNYKISIWYQDSNGNYMPGPQHTAPGCGLLSYKVPTAYFRQGDPNKNLGNVLIATVQFTLDWNGSAGQIADIRDVLSYGDTHLGFVGGDPVPISTSNSAGNDNTYDVKFGVPCDETAPPDTLFWRDDDFGGAPEGFGTDMRAYLFRDGGGTYGSVSGMYPQGSPPDGFGGTDVGRMHVSMSPKQHYTLSFQHVNAANTISVQYPYDSAYYYIGCGSQQPAAGDLGVCDQTYNFIIPSTSNGYSQNYKVWVRVWAKDDNGFWNDDAHLVYDQVHVSTASIKVDLDKLRSNQGFKVIAKPFTTYNPAPPSGDGKPNVGSWAVLDADTGQCFDATCSISVPGGLPGGGLKADEVFYATLSVHNNSGTTRIPGAVDGVRAFGIKSTGNLGPWDRIMASNVADDGFVHNYINPGDTWSWTVALGGGSGSNNYTVTGYPAFINNVGSWPPTFAIGAGCGPTVTTYQHFDSNSNPDIQLATDPENPTMVTATATINGSGAVPAPIAGGTLQIRRNGATVSSGPVGSGSAGNYTVTPVTINATPVGGVRFGPYNWNVGDAICAVINYSYKSGWSGPPGYPLVFTADDQPNSGDILGRCNTITNRPYVSVFGNDVTAGGGFGSSCGATNRSVNAYTRTGGGGSGTQLAAYAGGSISGFKTAFLRAAVPGPDNGLSFTSFAQANLCTTDYYNDEQYADGDARKHNTFAPPVINLNAPGQVADNEQTVKSGNLTIQNGSGFDKHHTIFVDGDVYIKDNIAYTTTWSTIANIPFFTLIVKGNIYIDKGVTQLDGKYIAQPGNSGGGHIYTCAYSSGSSWQAYADTTDTLWSNCQTKLTIHGQFIADHIHFMRTIHTLSDGSLGEPAGASNNSAESFEFSPEMYLGLPATRPTSTSTSGEYEYITTLPPIL